MARHQYQKGEIHNPNGRPKGSKNHKGFDVVQILRDLNYCPFTHLYEMATDESWSKRERTQAAVELCSYAAAKIKSVELSVTQKDQISILLNCTKKQKEEIVQEVVEEYPEKND